MRGPVSLFRIGAAGLLVSSLATSACNGPTTPTIIVPGPTITCPPAPAPEPSVTGQPVAVGYGAVNSLGGSVPVVISCTRPSGSLFPVGSTTVMCTATDAVQRSASCIFPVTVTAPPPPPPQPRLSVTRFLAFGDSITAGVVPDSTDTTTGRIRYRVVQPGESYPTQLQTMLLQRYTTQPTIVVTRDGAPGESAVQGVGRLDGDLVMYNPEVLLLLEGVNDIDTLGAAGIPSAINALRSMIRDARGRGVKVIVGTLLPQEAGLKRAYAPNLIVPFNAQLVPMAQSEGALVVDLYTGLLPDLADWISPLDGLHPSPAGYQEMAQLFFDAIRAAFEVPSSSTNKAMKTLR